MRWYLAISFMMFLAATSFAACSTETAADGGLCEPGSNVFCRCRGGGAGTKHCNDGGDSFGACETDTGSCDEVTGDPTSGSGGGPPGGEPSPPGELLGPCSEDADCKDGMTCPMGFCTMTCATYEDCSDAVGDCINWEGSPICMPYCVTQEHCEPYGLASRCGYTDDSLPPFDVVVCGNWGDNLQLPPDGYPPGITCDNDLYCNTGFLEVERVCDTDGCTDGCHVDSDCPMGQTCSSTGGEVGTCAGVSMEDGDDCPGIPLSISLSNPDVVVMGDTSQALPPSEFAVDSPCFASMAPESEDMVYEVTVADTGHMIIDLTTSDPNYDPQIYARQGSCAGGTQLGCSDEIGGGTGEIFEFDVTAGTIWVFVDGWQGSTGTFTLSLNLASM